MGFFSSLWEDAKKVAGGLWDAVCHVASFLFESVFWLVEVVFTAVEALFEWIDDMIDSIIDAIGSFFTGGNSEGGILPPSDEVVKVIEKHEKEYSTIPYSRKARQGKATIGYVTDKDGKIKGAKIIGSDKGFDTQISEAHKRNRIYATKIED